MYEFAVCSIFGLKFTTQLLKVSSNPPGKNQRSTAPRTTHTSIKTFFRAINRPVYLIGFFIHQTLLSARTHFLGDFGLEHIPRSNGSRNDFLENRGDMFFFFFYHVLYLDIFPKYLTTYYIFPWFSGISHLVVVVVVVLGHLIVVVLRVGDPVVVVVRVLCKFGFPNCFPRFSRTKKILMFFSFHSTRRKEGVSKLLHHSW